MIWRSVDPRGRESITRSM